MKDGTALLNGKNTVYFIYFLFSNEKGFLWKNGFNCKLISLCLTLTRLFLSAVLYNQIIQFSLIISMS